MEAMGQMPEIVGTRPWLWNAPRPIGGFLLQLTMTHINNS
jgi:hypothetical protein